MYTASVRRLRPLVFVLALLVSPLGVAVCEVVCGLPAHAAGHAPVPAETARVDAHAHHDHHQHHAPLPTAPVAPVSDADGVVTLPGPACDPLSGIPARVRSPFSGPDAHGVAVAHVASALDSQEQRYPRVVPADTGPPDPPRHAPVPLRI